MILWYHDRYHEFYHKFKHKLYRMFIMTLIICVITRCVSTTVCFIIVFIIWFIIIVSWWYHLCYSGVHTFFIICSINNFIINLIIRYRMLYQTCVLPLCVLSYASSYICHQSYNDFIIVIISVTMRFIMCLS